MKKKLLLLLGIFSLGLLNAQVGINTKNPLGIFHVDPKANTTGSGDTTDDIIITSSGNVGIGTVTPSARLHILTDDKTPAFRLQDGNEKTTRILTSDASGNGTWGKGLVGSATGILGNGAKLYLPDYVLLGKPFEVKDTGSYIDLSPGRWIVYVTFQLPALDLSKDSTSPPYWLRSTLYPTPNLEQLPDFDASIEDGNQISGIGWYNIPSIVTGFSVVNNTQTTTKRYHLYVGIISIFSPIPYTITIGGKGHPENNMVAIQINR